MNFHSLLKVNQYIEDMQSLGQGKELRELNEHIQRKSRSIIKSIGFLGEHGKLYETFHSYPCT